MSVVLSAILGIALAAPPAQAAPAPTAIVTACVDHFVENQHAALFRGYTGCAAWQEDPTGASYDPASLRAELSGDLGRALVTSHLGLHPDDSVVPARCLFTLDGPLLCRALEGPRAFPLEQEPDLAEAATHSIEFILACDGAPISVDVAERRVRVTKTGASVPRGPGTDAASCAWHHIEAIRLIPGPSGEHNWDVRISGALLTATPSTHAAESRDSHP